MLVATGVSRVLGTDGSRLAFSEGSKPKGAWAGKRLLVLDDRPAFELSLWCGTCPFLFERLEGASKTLSMGDMANRLAEGLDGIDEEIVGKFGSLLPRGEYVPLLLELRPRLVRPSDPDDYFSREQVETRGIDAFWGLPEYPRTPYYRTFETPVDAEAHLYEFVVPMVPPSWNDVAQVAVFAEHLDSSSKPTAVSVSTLDVCAPAVDDGLDWYAHWGLTHFLLDGHHKMQAAAERERPLRMLALPSVDGSLAGAQDISRIVDIRRQPVAARVPPSDAAG